MQLDDGTELDADLLLVATGRVPNGDRLNAAAAGVEVHDGRAGEGRRVPAHVRRRTSGHWATSARDYQLKHVANHEARVVAHNLAHPDDQIESDHRFVPSAVFTASAAGHRRPDRGAGGRAAGLDYVTAMQDYGGTAYGWAMEDTHQPVQAASPTAATGQLVGAHIMGEQASTLIQPLIQAMSFGLGVREMARGQYWIHPALTEVVENALLKLQL